MKTKLWCSALVLVCSFNAFAVTAFLKYETTTGMTKQCVYEFAGNEYTVTKKSYQLCPLSIDVDP